MTMKRFTVLFTTVLFASLFVALFSLQPVQAEDPQIKKVLIQVKDNPGKPVVDASCLVRNADGGTGGLAKLIMMDMQK